MQIPGVPGTWLSYQVFYDSVSKRTIIVGNGTSGGVYVVKETGTGWTSPVAL